MHLWLFWGHQYGEPQGLCWYLPNPYVDLHLEYMLQLVLLCKVAFSMQMQMISRSSSSTAFCHCSRFWTSQDRTPSELRSSRASVDWVMNWAQQRTRPVQAYPPRAFLGLKSTSHTRSTSTVSWRLPRWHLLSILSVLSINYMLHLLYCTTNVDIIDRRPFPTLSNSLHLRRS